jgi:Ca2+-binding EF-hand superfamily protein
MSGLSSVGSGGFTAYAAKQFQQNLFNQIDLNGDGSVSKSELEQAVTKAGGGIQAADALYSALDPANSGGFGAQQFGQAFPGSGISHQMQAQMIGYQAQGWPGTSSTQAGGQLAQNLFSQIDSNGDGSISKSELEQAVTKSGGTKEGADALYAKLDPNGTGSVSQQQFSQSLLQAMPHPHHHHHHGGGSDAASATDSSATGGGSAADALTSLFNADGGGPGNSPTQIAQNMFSRRQRGRRHHAERARAVGHRRRRRQGRCRCALCEARPQRHRQREPAAIHRHAAAALGRRKYRAGRPAGAPRPGHADGPPIRPRAAAAARPAAPRSAPARPRRTP